MKVKFGNLIFTERLARSLRNARIKPEQLASFAGEELTLYPGIGLREIQMIEQQLVIHGTSLRPNELLTILPKWLSRRTVQTLNRYNVFSVEDAVELHNDYLKIIFRRYLQGIMEVIHLRLSLEAKPDLLSCPILLEDIPEFAE